MNELTKMSVEWKPLEQNSYPELFHYTSLEGLEGILKSGILWATNARHLNDTTEFLLLWENILPYIRDYLQVEVRRNREQYQHVFENLEEGAAQDAENFIPIFKSILMNNLNEPYVTSFTTHEDDYNRRHGLLSQWRGYGSEGVAIVFDYKKLEELIEDEKDRFQYLACSLRKTVYQINDFNLENGFPDLLRVLERFAVDYAAGLGPEDDRALETMDLLNYELLLSAGSLKHRGFQEENEYRIILGVPDYQRIDEIADPPINPAGRKEVHFRNGRCDSIPFIKVFERSGDLPITRILVGPSRNQIANEYQVKKLLPTIHPYAEIELERSEIPFVSSA